MAGKKRTPEELEHLKKTRRKAYNGKVSPGPTRRSATGELILDPKKQKFLEAYYSPESETYANAYRSALAAGFSPSYAKVIMSPSYNNTWVKIENFQKQTSLTPAHIVKSAEKLALRGKKEDTQLKAIEFLAKIHGMLVEKKITANVNIEELLNTKDEDAKEILNKDILDL